VLELTVISTKAIATSLSAIRAPPARRRGGLDIMGNFPGSRGPAMEYELRDPSEARAFLLEGLWWQRAVAVTAATVRPALEWAMEAASGGQPLPPVGFLADLGHVALGLDLEARGSRSGVVAPSVPVNLLRTYEDHVLGKVYADWTFTEASDALRRYQGRDQARGLAFLLNQLRERCGFSGVQLSPGVIKAALEAAPEDALTEGWELLHQQGVQPPLVELYEELITAARRTPELLSPADLFELKHGYALQPEGERLARRQVLHAAELLERALPRHRVRPLERRREVPTRILDEDTYPIGGFSSIATRGSPESLLHSQLAYMETDERPDLFDVKFLRDELLYYARDENQLLRRRRTFVFALYPDLVNARFKDAALPYQRGVMLLALLVSAVRKLCEWLSTDALQFHLLFVGEGADSQPPALAAEWELLRTLLPEPITNGLLHLERVRRDRVGPLCAGWVRRSMVHGLVIGIEPPVVRAADAVVSRLKVAGAFPALGDGDDAPVEVEADDAADSWGLALQQLLARWI
jgi:hypothetical protein